MASYQNARSQHQTVASGNGNGDTVTLNGDYDNVETINRAASGDIYWTVDGTTPTIGAAGTYIVRAGEALTVPVPTSGNTVVKLVGTASCAYSVTGVTS